MLGRSKFEPVGLWKFQRNLGGAQKLVFTVKNTWEIAKFLCLWGGSAREPDFGGFSAAESKSRFSSILSDFMIILAGSQGGGVGFVCFP